jgi:hypothetical protein
VIEANSNWHEDAGNVLVTYHVYVPLHACAAGSAANSAEAGVGVFLAPSATTGTLIARGHRNQLVAAIAPWTTESENEKKSSSSVQLASCIARYEKYVDDDSSAGFGSDQQMGGSWVCVHGPDQHNFNDSLYELSADCNSSSIEDGGAMTCHAYVHLMVTESRIPEWATGYFTLIDSSVANLDHVHKQVLRSPRLMCGWTTVAARHILLVGCIFIVTFFQFLAHSRTDSAIRRAIFVISFCVFNDTPRHMGA